MRNPVLICVLALPMLAQSPGQRVPGAATPVVSITRTGILRLDGRDVNIRELNANVERRPNAAQGVYLRPEKDVPWGLVSQALSELQNAKPPFSVKLTTQENAPR